MSKYQFVYINDIQGGADVAVQFDDTHHPFIEDVLVAFEQFLLGVTFQPGTIRKYINMEAVQEALLKRAELARALSDTLGR
jgi:hypothetical protein